MLDSWAWAAPAATRPATRQAWARRDIGYSGGSGTTLEASTAHPGHTSADGQGADAAPAAGTWRASVQPPPTPLAWPRLRIPGACAARCRSGRGTAPALRPPSGDGAATEATLAADATAARLGPRPQLAQAPDQDGRGRRQAEAVQRPPGRQRHADQPERQPADPFRRTAQLGHQAYAQQAGGEPVTQHAFQHRLGRIVGLRLAGEGGGAGG